jgi:hypothetical protein
MQPGKLTCIGCNNRLLILPAVNPGSTRKETEVVIFIFPARRLSYAPLL